MTAEGTKLTTDNIHLSGECICIPAGKLFSACWPCVFAWITRRASVGVNAETVTVDTTAAIAASAANASSAWRHSTRGFGRCCARSFVVSLERRRVGPD